MVAPSDSESVEYDIILQAAQAMQSLQALTTQATTFNEKINMVSANLKAFAAETGLSMKSAVSMFKEFDQIMSDSGEGSALFGQMQKQGWIEVGDAVDEGTGRAVRGIDAMRIALGAVVAMIVFQVIQAFQSLFTMAVTGLREMETGLYNLANAEKNLSEQGIGITPEDLQAIIDKLQKLDPLLSKIQATELVSSIATRVAPQVGFNKEQIQQLSEAIAILSIRNKGLGKSFEEVEKQVTDAFLTGKVSVAINNLGVKINDQIVKDEALRLGLVKTADEFDKLTGKVEANVKAQALLSLVSANANKDLAHLPDYFKTADAAFGIFQARLQDVMTKIGQQAGPLIKQIFLDLATLLGKVLDYLTKNDKAVASFVSGLMILAKFVGIIINLFVNLIMVLSQVGAAITNVLSKIPGVNSIIKGLNPSSQNSVDTPTGTSSDASDKEAQNQANVAKAVAEGQSKIQDLMQESADKKADIETEYGRKLEDIAQDYSHKVEDIERDTAQKREDALRNYNQKVEDVNRKADEDVAQAKEDARRKEIDREKQFQEKMRELRDKFLFDLEDALRERDARAVLRLIRQYNLDKKNLEERNKLERQQAKKDLATKLQDIERERQLKLQAAKREYDDKLQEIAIGEQRALDEAKIWQQRQLADAALWHQRQLQEYQQYLQRKLRDLANALIKEYQLTAAGAAAIYKLLQGYFGANGAIAGLFNNQLSASLNGILSTSSSGVGGTSGQGSFASTFNTVTNGMGYGFAEGGSFIATRPTKLLVGERDAEKIDVTPLNRVGNNVGKIFGDKSAMGMGGDVSIRLELSPDLEARIVDSSLENLSVHIDRISRSK